MLQRKFSPIATRRPHVAATAREHRRAVTRDGRTEVLLAEARAALAEYIEVYGEPDEAAMAETRARLDKAGVGQRETTDEAAARMAALARLRGKLPVEPQRRAG
ncbi:MAG: hypothetical protein ACRDRU_27760 [Pseudonocardiaceae bacterium]